MKMKSKGKEKINEYLWQEECFEVTAMTITQWKSASASLAIEGRFLEGSVFKKKLSFLWWMCTNKFQDDGPSMALTHPGPYFISSDMETRR